MKLMETVSGGLWSSASWMETELPVERFLIGHHLALIELPDVLPDLF